MPVIQNLLRRWGFVKLDRYGLMQAPDGRILSMRPAVLDDGAGGRDVGWEDGDLVGYSQESWGDPGHPAATILANNFTSLYPFGVEVGLPGSAGFSMVFSDALATCPRRPQRRSHPDARL